MFIHVDRENSKQRRVRGHDGDVAAIRGEWVHNDDSMCMFQHPVLQLLCEYDIQQKIAQRIGYNKLNFDGLSYLLDQIEGGGE